MKLPKTLIALLSGLLFGLGLIISGMVAPQKIIAFLDISEKWNPALAFVMLGAIATCFPAFYYARKKAQTLCSEPINLPTQQQIDTKLIAGAALFGVGWGLTGYCPGPAIMAVLLGSWKTWSFVAAMLAGMFLYDKFLSRDSK